MKRIITIIASIAAFSAAHAQSTRAEAFILGADISWIQQQENNGIRYYHNGERVDPFEVLRDHGFNYIRLRLFVDPTAAIPDEPESPYSSTNQPGRQADATIAYCGLDSTVAMAKRAKAAGMKILLDFHYSDTWADPEKQHKPMSWRHLTTMPALTAQVREYTRETLERFAAEGVLPDMVQIGNETVGGMIWPEGKNWGGAPGSWSNFAALVNAGIDGVKDVSDDIQIMVHTINEQNPIWWLTTLIDNGVSRIDVFGLSYYTEYHGEPDSLARVAAAFASNSTFSNLGIKFCVVEYAFNHRVVNDIVFNMPDNKGLGTFVWEPFDWRETLFDWRDNPSGRHSNERLQWYLEMSRDYGNDDDGDDGDDDCVGDDCENVCDDDDCEDVCVGDDCDNGNDDKCEGEIVDGECITLSIRNNLASTNYRMNIASVGNGAFRINYTMRNAGNVRIELFDIRGRRVRTLVNTSRSAGNHNEIFNIRNLSSSTYIVRMQAGNNVLYNRVLLR